MINNANMASELPAVAANSAIAIAVRIQSGLRQYRLKSNWAQFAIVTFRFSIALRQGLCDLTKKCVDDCTSNLRN